MPADYWSAPLNAPANLIDGAALANSTSLTAISSAPDLAFLAGDVKPGQRYRLTAFGKFSTTGTPTLLIAPYWGGAAGVLLLTGASGITTLSGASAATWWLEALLTVRNLDNPAAATVMGAGRVSGISAAGAVDHVPATTPAVATIDTTGARKALVLAAQWGTANAANTITCSEFLVEALG